jgi:hypothetical protein
LKKKKISDSFTGQSDSSILSNSDNEIAVSNNVLAFPNSRQGKSIAQSIAAWKWLILQGDIF